MKNTTLLSTLLITFILNQAFCQDSEWHQDIREYKTVKNITYYFPSSTSLDYRNSTIENCQEVIKENLSLIKETEFTMIMDIEFLSSNKEFLRYTGQNGQGAAYYYRKAVFSLIKEKNSPIKHEMMHMISVDKWGIPSNSSLWMYEGLATYSAGYCSEYTLEQVYQYFIQSGKLIPLDSLGKDFRSYSDVISYTESAFLVKYLINNYGLEKFKKLWIEGLDKIKDIYGFSDKELQETIKNDFKNKFPQNIEFEWKEFEKGCE